MYAEVRATAWAVTGPGSGRGARRWRGSRARRPPAQATMAGLGTERGEKSPMPRSRASGAACGARRAARATRWGRGGSPRFRCSGRRRCPRSFRSAPPSRRRWPAEDGDAVRERRRAARGERPGRAHRPASGLALDDAGLLAEPRGLREEVPGRVVPVRGQGHDRRRRLLLVRGARRRRDQHRRAPRGAVRGRVGPPRAPGGGGPSRLQIERAIGLARLSVHPGRASTWVSGQGSASSPPPARSPG